MVTPGGKENSQLMELVSYTLPPLNAPKRVEYKSPGETEGVNFLHVTKKETKQATDCSEGGYVWRLFLVNIQSLLLGFHVTRELFPSTPKSELS